MNRAPGRQRQQGPRGPEAHPAAPAPQPSLRAVDLRGAGDPGVPVVGEAGAALRLPRVGVRLHSGKLLPMRASDCAEQVNQ